MTAATLAPARPQPVPTATVLRNGRHEDTVACTGCGEPFIRAKRATYGTCLGCQMARALADAGIGPDDPGMRRWSGWNAIISAARGRVAAQDRSSRAAAMQGVVSR